MKNISEFNAYSSSSEPTHLTLASISSCSFLSPYLPLKTVKLNLKHSTISYLLAHPSNSKESSIDFILQGSDTRLSQLSSICLLDS